MQIDYVSVFERLRKRDILYGGNNNFAVKKEIEPFIDFEDRNEVLAYKYLLVQYEFYVFHSLHCMDALRAGGNENDLSERGFTSYEIATARTLLKRYGDGFKRKRYLYEANIKIELIAHTICLILENKSLSSIPEDIVQSARRRMNYSNEVLKML